MISLPSSCCHEGSKYGRKGNRSKILTRSYFSINRLQKGKKETVYAGEQNAGSLQTTAHQEHSSYSVCEYACACIGAR